MQLSCRLWLPNSKPYTHAKEVCKALEYAKATKTTDIVKEHL